MHEEFIDGEFYAGFGVYGQGTYTDLDIMIAVQYANQFAESEGYGEGGVVQAILLPKGLRMPSDEVLQKVANEAHEARMAYYNKYEMKGRYNANNTRMYREANALVEVDIGRRLTAMGYQAYPVKPLDGSKNHVVILDRSAVTVAEAPVYIDGKLNS